MLNKDLDDRASQPIGFTVRDGLPHRAERYTGPRRTDVGQDDPKASDHVPLAVDIPFAALV